jgi:hypothetical protein
VTGDALDVVFEARLPRLSTRACLRLRTPLASAAGAQTARADPDAGMGDVALVRLVSHFERFTRHIAATLPGHADVLVDFNEARGIEDFVVYDNDID